MKKQASILFIQHADIMGGSVISLREIVMDAVRNNYNCTVLCRNATVAGIYETLGAATIVGSVATLNHNTALSYKLTPFGILRFIKAILRTILTLRSMYRIARSLKADIVHLNSSNLILYTILFSGMNIPVVLHVREVIVKGYGGVRKSIIGWLASRFATAIIYISESEMRILKTQADKSFVVYNYIHEETFKSNEPTYPELHGSDRLRVITLGGLFGLKGGKTMLQSLVASANTELIVLGCEDPRVNSKEMIEKDGHVYTSEIMELLAEDDVARRITFRGRVNNPAPDIKEANCVFFYAGLPHFPRPVFEAWLLRRPVIYFNPHFDNDIITSDNVYFLNSGSSAELSQAFENIRKSDLFTRERLNSLHELALENFSERNFDKIETIYQTCLKRSRPR